MRTFYSLFTRTSGRTIEDQKFRQGHSLRGKQIEQKTIPAREPCQTGKGTCLEQELKRFLSMRGRAGTQLREETERTPGWPGRQGGPLGRTGMSNKISLTFY